METYYILCIGLLFLLAIFDLFVGVSNDAVNFLNSAIGSKVASFKTIMFIAAIGVFAGAALSNGMMEIARHGIYQPQHFVFAEIMVILMAVMLTDVVLLDVFNSLGMPTSTTVSLVFELLGGTFALAMIKISKSAGELSIGQLLNTEKALSVIIGIFLSVAIAFFFGAIVQYLARLLFTFNYKRTSKYFIGLFGGFAATAIIYFMLIKGLKDAAFMTAENLAWVKAHTVSIILYCMIAFTLLMQALHMLKVNVFKVVVLLGTFALALAFAGNDLVNFIGVPLAGFSAFTDFMANGNGAPDSFLMTSLNSPAQTPWYFLVGAGVIMVFALTTSKKAHNVVKTSINLSRQEEGEETFGTTPVARSLVRTSSSFAQWMNRIIPEKTKNWVNSRFQKDELILENEAAFDVVRAAVNLVLSGVLIAIGTSLKLPLSTTYVTFMVAMGTSLADRAWGRESAVFRITGVLSVVGGWFITAGVAFIIAFLAAIFLYYGGIPATAILAVIAVTTLIRSQITFKKKQSQTQSDPTIAKLMNAKDPILAMQYFRQFFNNDSQQFLGFAEVQFVKVSYGFMNENLRQLRKASDSFDDEKDSVKKIKRLGTLGMRRLDANTAIEKGGYFYQGTDFKSEIMNSLDRITESCLEHVDNNFNPLEEDQKTEFQNITQAVSLFLNRSQLAIQEGHFDDNDDLFAEGNQIINKLMGMKKSHLERIRNNAFSAKTGMVYLTMIQEAQNICAYTINLIKVTSRLNNN